MLTITVPPAPYCGESGASLLMMGNAAYTLVHGMTNATFTGDRLDDYVTANGSVDFVGARAIVNGDDGRKQAQIVSGYAHILQYGRSPRTAYDLDVTP